MESAAESLVAQGKAALRRGEAGRAEALAEARLAEAPGDLDALQLRFYAERRQGRIDAALETLRRVLELKTDAVWALVELATEQYRRGDQARAREAARQALRFSPLEHHAHFLLGSLLSDNADLAAGEWHLRKAIEIAGAKAPLVSSLAQTLMQQGRHDESEALFEQAHGLDPGRAATLAHWASLCEVRGEFDRALELIGRASADANSKSDLDLIRAMVLSRQGKNQAALDALAHGGSAPGEALAAMRQLERGRLYDRLGRHDEAWADFVEAKRRLAVQGARTYDRDAVDNMVLRLKAFFSGTNLKLLPRAMSRRDTPRPIFILGFPRSGTTMIEQVLSSHSTVQAGGELAFMSELIRLAPQILSSPFNFPEALAELWMGDRLYGPAVFREYYLTRADQKGLFSAGLPHFTDKQPLNEMYLPFIRLVFPEAKFVHLVRNPLDVAVSVMSRFMTHGFNFAFDVQDFAHHYAQVSDLVEHHLAQMPDLPYHRIHYEDFVQNQGEETRRLLDFLDLPFEEACISFHENRRYAHTASYAQVTEKLYDRSIGRHEHYARHLDPIRPVLQRAIDGLGYA